MEERGQLHAQTSLTPQREPNIPSVDCWVGVKVDLEVLRKNDFAPHRESNLRPANP